MDYFIIHIGLYSSQLNNKLMILVNPFKNPQSSYLSFNVDLIRKENVKTY